MDKGSWKFISFFESTYSTTFEPYTCLDSKKSIFAIFTAQTYMYVKEAMAHVMTWDESVYITMFNRQAIQVMGQLVRLDLI